MKLKYWIFLLLILLVSLFLRVWSWEQVFPKGIGNLPILLKEVDSYYHLRLIDNMLVNFPQSLRVDQYATLGGIAVGCPPLSSWIVKILTDLATSFNIQVGPNVEYLAETISTFLPPIVGTLSVLLICILGTLLLNKTAGLIGALLAGVLPTEFLHRSLLGYLDHHSYEVLFLLCTLVFLLLLEKRKNILWSIPAGVSIGLYLLNWAGGLLLVGIVLIWICIKFLVDYFKYSKLELSLYIGTSFSLLIGYFISLLLLLTFTDFTLFLVFPAIASIVPIGLYGISRIKDKRMVLGILGAFISITASFLVWKQDILYWVVNSLLAVFWGFNSTIQETIPTDFITFFAAFGITFIFSFIGLWYYSKNKPNILFLVFFVFFFLAMLGQRRWIYYGAVPLCLLAGFSVYFISEQVLPKLKSSIILICIFFLVIVPIKGIVGVSTMRADLPFQWFEALTWLRDNTPEPFTDTNAYYKLEVKEKAKYTILSWWDYGHWIIEISRRVPLTSPAWQVLPEGPECQFLLGKLPDSKKYLKDLRVKYIIVDEDMVYGKFYAIAERYSPGIDKKKVEEMWPTSTVKSLWEGEPEGFKVIHTFQTVKILEVLDYAEFQ